MARTSTTKKSRSQQSSENQETVAAEAKPIKKVEAAMAAIHEGIESPQSAVAYIAKRFGIEMKAQHFSTIKCQWKKKLEEIEGAEAAGVTPKSTGAIEGYLAPPPTRSKRSTGEPDLIDAMETLKTLIAELGTDKVKRIVELLG